MGSKNNSSCVILNLDICKTSNNKFLIDSGAEVSLLKINCLKPEVRIVKETCLLKGISTEQIRTIGICEAFISFKDNKIISHKFYIVDKDFAIPDSGLVGRDFLFKHKVDLFYSKNLLTFFSNNASIVNLDLITKTENLEQVKPLNKPSSKLLKKPEHSECVSKSKIVVLPARTELVVQVPTPIKETSVCLTEEVQPNVFVGNLIIGPDRNNNYFISIVNSNEIEVELTKFPKFLPLKEFKILSIESKNEDRNNYDNFNNNLNRDRDEMVRSIILDRLDSLSNIEERNILLDICMKYSDIFHLEGEHLTCTDKYSHKIDLYTDTRPIYTKPYRIPQSQKRIVDEEIKRLLEEDTICHSISPWNSPLLLVPKKTGIDGKKNIVCVLIFENLMNIQLVIGIH